MYSAVQCIIFNVLLKFMKTQFMADITSHNNNPINLGGLYLTHIT